MGANTTSYKFALAKSLIDLSVTGKSFISLEELAVPFSESICEHIQHHAKQGKNANFKIMDADELGEFLSRASEKIKSQEDKLPAQPETIFYSTTIKEKQPAKTISEVKVKRAGIGVVPLVDQIKKAALADSNSDKKEPQTKKSKTKVTTKENMAFSLKDSRPTGPRRRWCPGTTPPLLSLRWAARGSTAGERNCDGH